MPESDFVSPDLWGKDHWSTLAYVETMLVEFGKFEIASDPRMRTDRHNWRIKKRRPKLRRPSALNPHFMERGKHGTRLNDGSVLDQHDDWDCVQDMAAAGMLDRSAERLDLGHRIEFNARGRAVALALRDHKMRGGNFAGFRWPAEVARAA